MSIKFELKLWDQVSFKERERYVSWLVGQNHPDDPKLRIVSCSLCEEVIFPCIGAFDWASTLTVEEQQHEASERHQERHQAAILLKKLAGE